ncbi:MAG: hypothetical protein R1F52_00565 [Candidatus Nitrosoabyssus spongiisocia]|nr:MAG: hypothetical protein R1F52_00565 [Nitrosopumilaceae archaeon AB1(1)]
MNDDVKIMWQNILKLKKDIEKLPKITDSPEMINNTNLLRNNESLIKRLDINEKMLNEYMKYTRGLENTLKSMIKMQKELVTLLQTVRKKKQSKR